MNSCLYECSVFHRRLVPQGHEFTYRIFWFALDLDELSALPRRVAGFHHNEPGLYEFRDSDHLPLGEGDARANAEKFLAAEGVTDKPARIVLVTNTRCLGYIFNPIAIWYCFRADGSPLAAIAEVGNTFGELKPYLVPWTGTEFHRRTPKHFYVSPFSELDLEFDFRFALPGERLGVWIDDYCGPDRTLISSVSGRRTELTAGNLLACTARHPLITLRTIFLIHWHAFLLWKKNLPFHRKEANVPLQKDVLRPHRSLPQKAQTRSATP
jgi:uncharacterized protein